jgi:hypothetical protein
VLTFFARFILIVFVASVATIPVEARSPGPRMRPDPAMPPDPILRGAVEWREAMRADLSALLHRILSDSPDADAQYADAMRDAIAAFDAGAFDRALGAAMSASARAPQRSEPYLLASLANASIGLFQRAATLLDSARVRARAHEDDAFHALADRLRAERDFWSLLDDGIEMLARGRDADAAGTIVQAWRRFPDREAAGALALYAGLRSGAPFVDELLDSLGASRDETIRALSSRARPIAGRPIDGATDSALGSQIAQLTAAIGIERVVPASDASTVEDVYLGEPLAAPHKAWQGEVSISAEYAPINVYGNWTGFLSLGGSVSAVIWLDDSFRDGVELHVPVHLMFAQATAPIKWDGSQAPASRSSLRPELRFWTGPFGLSMFADASFFDVDMGAGRAVDRRIVSTAVGGAGVTIALGGGPRPEWRLDVRGGLGFLGASTSYYTAISAAYDAFVFDIEHESFSGRTYYGANAIDVSSVRLGFGWRGFPFHSVF